MTTPIPAPGEGDNRAVETVRGLSWLNNGVVASKCHTVNPQRAGSIEK